MARQKTAISPAMKTAIEEVAEAYSRYEKAREERRPEAWRLVMLELDRLCSREHGELLAALRKADELGVPRSRLQTPEVLGSTDQGKVRKLLGETGKRKRRGGTVPMFSWIGDDEARVMIHGFETRSSAADYPEVLSGVVKRIEEAPAGWGVLVDETDDGDLPGHLRWELDQEPYDGHLGQLLDGLAKKAKR